MKRTYLAPEEHAYTARGAQARRCLAIYPDGKIRVAWGGVPDTYFSIPAHGRIRGRYVAGFLSVADNLKRDNTGALIDNPDAGELLFTPYQKRETRGDAQEGGAR